MMQGSYHMMWGRTQRNNNTHDWPLFQPLRGVEAMTAGYSSLCHMLLVFMTNDIILTLYMIEAFRRINLFMAR